MKVQVEVVCLNADGEEQRRQVLTIERRELAMETLGMNLTESKALLAGVQDFVVAQQAREELEQRRACPTAAGGTRPRTPAAPQLARYSAELRCPIRDGTAAAARRRAPRRSVQ